MAHLPCEIVQLSDTTRCNICGMVWDTNDSNPPDCFWGLGAPELGRLVEGRVEWLIDAIATATQNRMFLLGDPLEDKVATAAIRDNARKALSVALYTYARTENG